MVSRGLACQAEGRRLANLHSFRLLTFQTTSSSGKGCLGRVPYLDVGTCVTGRWNLWRFVECNCPDYQESFGREKDGYGAGNGAENV